MKYGLTCILLITLISAFSQQQFKGRFLIFKFTCSYKTAQHTEKSYYWVLEDTSSKVMLDSLKILYIQDVSDSIMFRLMHGVEFSLFDFQRFVKTASTKQLEDFRKMRMHFLPLQSVLKKWPQNGQEMFLQVLMVPVKGCFMRGNLDSASKSKLGYSGCIFFPIGRLEYDQEFSLLNVSNQIKKIDFSSFLFDIVPPMFDLNYSKE